MPSPYSYDLRTKVIQAVESGMRKTEVSRIFKISRNTIDLWLKRKEKIGNYQAIEKYQKGYNPKITDDNEFKEFAQKHGSKTQEEMAEAWKDKISARTIGKALKKFNFTRKKRLMAIEKEMKKKTGISKRNNSKKTRRPSIHR